MTNSFLDTADPGDADLNAIYTVSGGDADGLER